MLKEIEDYNRYDCRSTRRLRDWLIATRHRIRRAAAAARSRSRDGAAVEDDRRPRPHVDGKFAGDGVEERTPEQTAVAMVAAARGYHRREDKPFWWAHFDRLNNPVDEWGDNSDVFVADDVAEVVKDWHLPRAGTKAAALGAS